MSNTVVRAGVRLLKRDINSGDLRVLALSVIVAVACAVSVTAFTDRLRGAIENSGSDAIGADLVLASSFPPEQALEDAARALGLNTSRFTTTRSVVVAEKSTALASVKAVDAAYPLRGKLRTTPELGEPDVERDTGPSPGSVWVDPRLAALLDVHRGDSIDVGALSLKLEAILVLEPDRGGQLFSIAPRLMMNRGDLAATDLLQPGSLSRHRLLVSGSADGVARWRSDVKKQLGAAANFIDAGSQGPRLGMAIERGERFLSLAALISVLLAGAAIARSAQHYAERQLDAAALMRSVGASRKTVLLIYLMVLFVVALIASLIGSLTGFVGQGALVQILPGLTAGELPAPSLMPVVYGVTLGVLTVIAFALPALLRLHSVAPLRVLKRDLGSPAPGIIASYALALILLMVFIFWITRDVRLGIWLLAGVAATLALLALVSLFFLFCVKHLGRRSGVSWRYGIASLTRNRGAMIAQTTALGVGVMAMLLLTFVRTDLLELWESRLPPDTPNHFLLGVKPTQRDALLEFATREKLGVVNFATMTRARLEQVNGQSVSSDDYPDGFAKRMMQRAANLSVRSEIGNDNELIAGTWWKEGDAQDQVSVEADYASDLGFKLGDVLSYRIADQVFDLRVTSLRTVDWDSFKPNFFLVTPPGALTGVTPGYIASVHVDQSNATYLRNLVREFPNVTDIDVDAVLTQVRRLLDQLNRALQYLFVFTIAAGLLVLYASVVTTYRDRQREVGILKTLGASRGQLNASLATEFASLGVIAGGVGAFAATLTGWLIGKFALKLNYAIDPVLWLAGLVAGGLLVAAAGIVSTRSVVETPPWASLRKVIDQ